MKPERRSPSALSLPHWYAEPANRHAQAWLARQAPAGHPDAGGFCVEASGWYDGRQTAYTLNFLLGLGCYAGASGLEPDRLGAACEAALAFLLRRQASDGRIDLNGTRSANETGFPLPGLAAAYRHLPRHAPALFDRMADGMREFMVRGAQAVLEGEPGTANHRWAAHAAALVAVHQLFPNPRYLRRIEELLADGIDCDTDGLWYEERSPNYNMVANHGLLVLADALGRDDLLAHVVRNCKLTLDLLQPNGECDTSFSFRQDRGRASRHAATYRIARRAALLTGDGRLSSLAEHVRDAIRDEGLMPMTFEWLDHPGDLPPSEPMPQHVDRFLADGSIFRHRRGITALTLTVDPGGHFFDTVLDHWGGPKRSEDWFHLHHGEVVVQSIRFTPSYGLGIQPSRLTRTAPDNYELAGEADGWPHTAHFRPGSPITRMRQRQTHRIRIHHDHQGCRIQLRCESPDALWGVLSIYIRPGSDAPPYGKLQAGTHYRLEASSLRIRSEVSSISIDGLPTGSLSTPVPSPSRIPGTIERDCACLSLSVRMPAELDIVVRLET